MSEEENVVEETTGTDELIALKSQADLMGIKYHPNIGVDKLKTKIAAKLEDKPPVSEQPSIEEAKEAESKEKLENLLENLTPRQLMARKKKKCSELVRVRVACMNPNKKDWPGEIISVGSSKLGTFKKFIPFDADEGWHVPRIIYETIKERRYQAFVKRKGPRGNQIVEPKLVKEFAVELMDPLTSEELQELASQQALSGSIDR